MTIAAVIISAAALVAVAVWLMRPPPELPTHWETMHADHEDRAAIERRLQWFERQWEQTRKDESADGY